MTVNGIRVPGWTVTAVVAAVALISAGVAFGQKVQQTDNALELLGVRLCRIETAVNLTPWPGCP